MTVGQTSTASNQRQNRSGKQQIHVTPQRVVSLAQDLVRTKSPLWFESDVARFLAAYLHGIGLEAEWQPVPLVAGRPLPAGADGTPVPNCYCAGT